MCVCTNIVLARVVGREAGRPAPNMCMHIYIYIYTHSNSIHIYIYIYIYTQ